MSTQDRATSDGIAASDLTAFIARLFAAAGLSDEAAAEVATGLVDADLEGLTSHGVMLVDMYIERLRRGSVSRGEHAAVVSEHAGTVVLDAGHALGQLTARQAMAIAVDKSRQFGAGIVAVRHGFHFGAAGRYAQQAAKAGCIGIAMCNTRPLMPAPGGAERVVGNNPLAIALPAAGEVPVTVAAAAHGYSRAAFYLVAASFERAGMAGLLDERRGRRGPVKLRPEITEFIRSAPPTSGAVLAEQVAERFGVVLHRRTIERVRGPR